jgi:error-prone DNA polymerase
MRAPQVPSHRHHTLVVDSETVPALECFDARDESADNCWFCIRQVREQAAAEVRTICRAGLAELLLVAYDVGKFCKHHGIPLAARGSATNSLVGWALGLMQEELCPIDYHLDSQLFVHEGRGDLPDLDPEVSSLHEPAVRAFLTRYGIEHGGGPRKRSADSLPRVGTLRLGINVSVGARQAVRSVGTALGLDPIRVHSLARHVPLLSSPGAVEQVLTRSLEMGGTLSASADPGRTILRVAGQLEGLPYRFGAHPSAYTVSFYGPGALSWLPAQWVSADPNCGLPPRPNKHSVDRLASELRQKRRPVGS